ncbi:MAG TPA: DUF2125 domain-containing protein [Rhodoblastus sp.]|nr:DUF2125 domain-containing protein [Rhodoblastus sp.]
MAHFRRPLLIGLIVILAVGLGEFWLYSSNQLAGFLHQRRIGGVSLADLCHSSDIGGFPLRLKLVCHGAAAPLRGGEASIFVGAEEAHGEISLFSPDHIVLTLSSPIVLQEEGGAPVAKLRHDGMTIDIAWTTYGLAQARIDVKSLAWSPESPRAGVAINMQGLTATAARQGSPHADDLIYELNGDGLTVPALQEVLKMNDLGNFTVAGTVAPPPAPAADWRAAVEDWRQRAGKITIDQLKWRAQDVEVRVAGVLSLDDAHRPAGKLDVTTEGAGPLLSRLGVPPAALQSRDLISVLLGRPGAHGNNGNALSLPVTLANGQISVGPIRIRGAAPPLY